MSVGEALNVPSLQTPQLLPFALSLVMQRLVAPWQIIRLATKLAGSDDEIRVAATPYGIAVTIALYDLSHLAAVLRTDIRRSHFVNVADNLKILHDGVRGLRTELDLRDGSRWGKQLTSVRADISNALQSEIDSVPGRVRRILRQRADKDITAGARIDAIEVDEAAALIDFVATCRNFASELAINEVTLRTYSDLQHYVEQATEALVQSLRGGDAKARAYRQMQAAAAIRFCGILFGNEYATLMSRAAENAGDRRPQGVSRKLVNCRKPFLQLQVDYRAVTTYRWRGLPLIQSAHDFSHSFRRIREPRRRSDLSQPDGQGKGGPGRPDQRRTIAGSGRDDHVVTADGYAQKSGCRRTSGPGSIISGR